MYYLSKGRFILRSEIPVLFMPSTDQREGISATEREYSLYFHIPFCKKKCLFCSIQTIQSADINMDSYTVAILNEFNKYKTFLVSHKINCVHFGGGTPSLLTIYQIRKIIAAVKGSIPNCNDVEIVFESHPESMSYKKIDYLSLLPKVTLNMGIQTFHNEQLELINRSLKSGEMINKLVYARKKEFYALGIDIIAGLPHSSMNSVLDDIRLAIDLGINNISLYPLRIEKGSMLYKNSRDPYYAIPDDRELIEIIESAKQYLNKAGYTAYSIFHWTNKMCDTYLYSRNQTRGGQWIGIGAGAYTYLDQTVYLNHSSLNDYMTTTKNINHFSAEKQNITSRIVWELSFMFREGLLDREYLNSIYGSLLKPCIDRLIKTVCNLGYASYDNNRMLTITSKGIVHFDKIEKIIERVVLSAHE